MTRYREWLHLANVRLGLWPKQIMSGSIATRSGDAKLRRHSLGQSGSGPDRQVPWGKGEGWASQSPQSQMLASSSLHTTSRTFSWTAFESDESSPSLCLTPAQSLHLLTLLHQPLLYYTNLLPWLLLLFEPLPPNNPPYQPHRDLSIIRVCVTALLRTPH